MRLGLPDTAHGLLEVLPKAQFLRLEATELALNREQLMLQELLLSTLVLFLSLTPGLLNGHLLELPEQVLDLGG